MSTRKADPVYVRASVWDRCNLDCVYCPKGEGMENRVPPGLRGRRLTVGDYCSNLSHLARSGLRGISFTGGEPTLNPDLPELVARARRLFDRVELTTNGRRLPEMLPALAPHLDLLKVSLDAVDPELVRGITRGTPWEADRAVASIRAGCAAGLPVGVNVVLMRSTIDQVDPVIDLCRAVNAEGHRGKAYVSVLDFYFSQERRALWEREFQPLEELESRFTARYGPSVVQERFGCRFFWFDAGGVQVRFKDSHGATHRAPKCRRCTRSCQEGVFALKHSVEGWVTTCPTGDPAFGVHLSAGLDPEEADRRLAPLLQDIANARPDPMTFATMLATHGLAPRPRPAAPTPYRLTRKGKPRAAKR